MVADEAGLQIEGLIDSAGPVGTKGPAQAGLSNFFVLVSLN